MKLSRQGGIIVAALIWVTAAVVFCCSVLYPLWEKERNNQSKLDDLHGKIQRARKITALVETIGKRASETQESIARMTQARSMGPPLVWFPAKLERPLSRFGITQAKVRLNGTVPDPEKPELQRTFWNVSFPIQSGVPDIQALLLALTAIENQERYIRILDCAFTTNEAAPFQPAGTVNLSAIVWE